MDVWCEHACMIYSAWIDGADLCWVWVCTLGGKGHHARIDQPATLCLHTHTRKAFVAPSCATSAALKHAAARTRGDVSMAAGETALIIQNKGG